MATYSTYYKHTICLIRESLSIVNVNSEEAPLHYPGWRLFSECCPESDFLHKSCGYFPYSYIAHWANMWGLQLGVIIIQTITMLEQCLEQSYLTPLDNE